MDVGFGLAAGDTKDAKGNPFYTPTADSALCTAYADRDGEHFLHTAETACFQFPRAESGSWATYVII